MLQSAAMPRTTRAHCKKDQQMNVRFTADEIRVLDQIAEIEDRDRAYLVGFFTRWGIEQYTRIGSLVVLRKKHLTVDRRLNAVEIHALERLRIREETNGNDRRGTSEGGIPKAKKKSAA